MKYFTLDRWVSELKKISAEESGSLLNLVALLRISGFNSEQSLRKALLRLEKKGIIKRIGKGLYLNSFAPARIEVLAMLLGKPCYISYESALSYYGILSQMPFVVTCATTGKPSRKDTPLGTILYRHINPNLFWGYIEKERILYAEPEKALLDWIYWSRKTGNAKLTLGELDFSLLNKERLQKYAGTFPESVRKVLPVTAQSSEQDFIKTHQRTVWQNLSPGERLKRSWLLRRRIKNPRIIHDRKLFPRP